MPRRHAVLLDVFDTVLTVDFDSALKGLAVGSGLTPDEWVAGLEAHGTDLMSGAVTPEQAFAATFALACRTPADLESLVRRDRELLVEHASVYPDVTPFLDEMAGRHIPVAFVSNCAPNTGPLLETLGLSAQVDQVILSCEVGASKPDARIYLAALDALGVDPAEALFVDDQAAYCSGAEELGIASVLIDRRVPRPGAVASLAEVLPML